METQAAGIGHNSSPFHETTGAIADLCDEAQNWADGEELTTPEQHDKVVDLIKSIRSAKTKADAARKEEAKPYDEAKAEIQERYNPFIQPKKGRADLAIETLNEVIAPYLTAQALKKAEAERKARAEAEAKELAAREALANSRGNLEQREEAELLVKEAKKAEAISKKLERTNVAKGARTVVDVEIIDMKEAGRVAWIADPDAFHELTLEVGKRIIRESRTRELQGFKITERKVI